MKGESSLTLSAVGEEAGALWRHANGESPGLPMRRCHGAHAPDMRKTNKGIDVKGKECHHVLLLFQIPFSIMNRQVRAVIWLLPACDILTKLSTDLCSYKRRKRKGKYVKNMIGKRSWGAMGREEKNGLSGTGWRDKKDLKTTAELHKVLRESNFHRRWGNRPREFLWQAPAWFIPSSFSIHTASSSPTGNICSPFPNPAIPGNVCSPLHPCRHCLMNIF